MTPDGRNAPPPAPPPPPSRQHTTSSSKSETETPSKHLDSPASTPVGYVKHPIERQLAVEQPYKPIYYFFYGTLTQPKILSHILDLKEQPILRPAKIIGYALTNCGHYRALLDGKDGQQVTGYACVVQSTEDELKLARYETDAYEAVSCGIWFTDGRDPARENHGMTFKYADDDEALKDGRFDRKLWEVRMGVRLPEKWRADKLREKQIKDRR